MQRMRLVAAGVLATAMALTGCSSGSSSPSASGSGSSGSSAEKITLNYWTHVNPPSQTVEKELIQQYESQNPNVTINYLPVDFGSLPAKLNTAIAGGGGPDIFNYFQSYAADLVNKKFLAPVDFSAFGAADASAFGALYPKAIVDGYTYGGTVFGVPHETSTYQFWINKASFAKAGFDPSKDFPKTWDDVNKVGVKLMSSGASKEGIALTLNSSVRDTLVLDSMARQAGGSLFSDDGKTAQLNSPSAIKALGTWGDMVHKTKISDPALGPTASTNAEDLFAAGTAGMTNVGGSWFVAGLKTSHPDVYKNYAVGQQPIYPGGPQIGGDLYGFGLFVPATSKYQAEAWKFAGFLATQGKAYFEGAGIWLGDNASLAAPFATSFENWDVFSEGFKRGFFLPPVVKYNELSKVIERAIQRVVLENQSPSDSLNQAQTEAEPLMS